MNFKLFTIAIKKPSLHEIYTIILIQILSHFLKNPSFELYFKFQYRNLISKETIISRERLSNLKIRYELSTETRSIYIWLCL